MDKQAMEARQMARELPLQERVKHYWEYYKVHTIVAVAVFILMLLTIISSINAPKYDIEVAYYGASPISLEQEIKIEEYLAKIIEDINGDGECKANLLVNTSSLEQQANEYQMATVQKFAVEVGAGTYPAFILDRPHLNYVGMADERADGIIESVKDVRNNATIAEILGNTDGEIYWCTRILFDDEIGEEEAELLHNNSLLIENSI